MAKNTDALNRLKPLTDVLLEHWERPRRAAEERATDLEEQLNKTKGELEKAKLVNSYVKASKKEWKKKARDLEEKLADMEARLMEAEATVEEGAARIAAAEHLTQELQRKLDEAEQRVVGAGRPQRRRRPEERHPFERRYNASKQRPRYIGSGV